MQIISTKRQQTASLTRAGPAEKKTDRSRGSGALDTFIRHAKGFVKGTALGLVSGMMGTRGSIGIAAGIGTSTAVAGVTRIDQADSHLESAGTGLVFGTFAAYFGAACGVPGVLGAAFIYGLRGAWSPLE